MAELRVDGGRRRWQIPGLRAATQVGWGKLGELDELGNSRQVGNRWQATAASRCSHATALRTMATPARGRIPLNDRMVNVEPQPPGEERSFPSADWLDSPLGTYLVEQEQRYFDAAVADLFGYHAIQIGLPQVDLLRTSRMTLRTRAAPLAPADLRTEYTALPVASNVVDLVLLPHVLEFSLNPHQILREVERVLMPDGHLLIAGLNPWSLWGIRRTLTGSAGDFPWQGEFISLLRLKDWLTLLGFEVTAGRMACYAPPVTQPKWLRRWSFMESAGDRWWPFAGGVYFLQAVKRVHGMRVIMPRWPERARARAALAVVPRRVREPELGQIAARDRSPDITRNPQHRTARTNDHR
jgi:SAM-dependent methyltransferase